MRQCPRGLTSKLINLGIFWKVKNVEDILIITLLEKIERAIRDIDNAMAGCGQKLKRPVWLRWL